MQRLQVYLAVDPSCIGVSVPQHRSYLGERGALAEHLSGQSMSKLMGAVSGRGVNPRTLEAMVNNRPNAT